MLGDLDDSIYDYKNVKDIEDESKRQAFVTNKLLINKAKIQEIRKALRTDMR